LAWPDAADAKDVASLMPKAAAAAGSTGVPS
jgi:hypothetical protein